MKYREGIDYWVRYVQFPNHASESVVVSHGDGTATIYLNTLFPVEVLSERLQHELRHLEQEHFYRDDLSIDEVERQADGVHDLLPDVMTTHPDGKIACFRSLDAFMHYLKSYAEQRRER